MYAVVYKVILRTGLFELIEIGSNYDAWCWGYDFFNTFTILLNLAVSIMYTFDNMEMKYGPLLLTLECLTVAFFAIDFLLRVFTAKYLYPDVSEPRAVWKYLISFSRIWWAASTLLTVGYGDIYPVTTMGKIFGIFIAFLGIGMVAIPTGIISAGFVDQYSRLKRIGEYGQEEDVHFIRICLDKNDKWIGHRIAELDFPQRIIVAVIQRDHRILVPKGDTVLKAGDVMVIGAESFQDKDRIKLKEITLQQRNPWTNQKIRDLDISRHSIIVLVRRHKKLIIPSGNLTLLEGDTVILYTQTHMANADDLEI